MKEFSIAAQAAFRIAAMEVEHGHHQYIEKEHLLIGLCSLEKMLTLSGNQALGPGDRQLVESEQAVIENVLSAFELDTAHVRRAIRRKLGSGSHTRTEHVIHRSDACKQVFERAEDLAKSTKSISCLQLFAALLEKPGDIILITFQEAGAVPAEVQQKLMAFITPQEATQHVVDTLLEKLLRSR